MIITKMILEDRGPNISGLASKNIAKILYMFE